MIERDSFVLCIFALIIILYYVPLLLLFARPLDYTRLSLNQYQYLYIYLLFYKLPSLKIPRYVLIVEEEFTAIVPNILDPSYSSYSSSSSSAMSCVKLFEN
jgi:hypothetical protein